jgi:hypothetical protein
LPDGFLVRRLTGELFLLLIDLRLGIKLARWAFARAWVTRDSFLVVGLPGPFDFSAFAAVEPLFVAFNTMISCLLLSPYCRHLHPPQHHRPNHLPRQHSRLRWCY